MKYVRLCISSNSKLLSWYQANNQTQNKNFIILLYYESRFQI